ncbi:hypothetical protein GF343_01190 [Candidatus Woesearchaeota archaeon]|nr:hypothetical protein [Candidatus Woesearchaeota archaeon]
MAVSEEIQEGYDKLKKKYLGKKTLLPRAIQKRVDYNRSSILGMAATILMVASALAMGATIAAVRKTPKQVPKLLENTPYYAPRDAGFIKRTPELVKAADVKTASSLYDTWKESTVSPSLFQCAEALDKAASDIDAMNFELAKTSLEQAQKDWANAVKQMGSTEETRLLLNRIVNTKQALAELRVTMELIKASVIIEIISGDVLPGVSADDKTQKATELTLLKRFIKQMESSVSIQDPELKKQVKDQLAQIDVLLAQVGK